MKLEQCDLYINNIGNIYKQYKDMYFTYSYGGSGAHNNKWVNVNPDTFIRSNARLLADMLKNRPGMATYLSSQIAIRIKDFKLSSKVFGFKAYKEELVGKELNNYHYEGLVDKEGKKWKGHVFKVYSETKKGYISFCEDDLEFVIPNFSGYYPPKDRTIRKGSIIRPRHKKAIQGYKNIKLGKKYAVCDVIATYPISKKPSIVSVIDDELKRTTVRLKHFKLV